MAWTDAARAAAAMTRKTHAKKGGYVRGIEKAKGSMSHPPAHYGSFAYSFKTSKTGGRSKTAKLVGTRAQADTTIKKIVARSGGGSIRRLG